MTDIFDDILSDINASNEDDDNNAKVVETTQADTSTSEPKAKKTRCPNYKVLNARVSACLFGHAVCVQLHAARTEAEARLDRLRTPEKAIANLHVASYRPCDICTQSCTTERLNVALYLVPLETDEKALQQMRNAKHMFLSPTGVEVAGLLGIVSTEERTTSTLHVCSPYCPYTLANHYPDAYDRDDDDNVFNNDWWHQIPLHSEQLPSVIYRCLQHNKFHICASVCEFMFDGISGTKVCPISKRAVADVMQNSFGDGVGTAEQQEKTNEAKNGNEDDNDRQRRSMLTARRKLLDAATVTVGGERVRRTAGVRATCAMRKKTRRAQQTTQPDQQKRIEAVVSAQEVTACRPYDDRSNPATYAMRVSAIAQVPFSERQAKYNQQFVVDRLYQMLHRSVRRAIFTLTDEVNRQVLFGNALLFATCCERAASIFHILLFGRERIAIEQSRFDKARPKAEKAVEQYVKTHEHPFIAQCASLYESTLRSQTRMYPGVELSAEFYRAVETYYAMRATIFYFGLMALPVRNTNMMRRDEVETISTAFSFEAFCVIIYELMRSGYTVRNVVLLARDTFLIDRLFPSSSVLNHMGMMHKSCTNIKTLITTLLKVAQPHGVSMRYIMDTTLPWERLAELSTEENPGRRVVEELIAQRQQQLYAMRAVRPPTPDPEDQ